MDIIHYHYFRGNTPPKHKREEQYRWNQPCTILISGLPTREEILTTPLLHSVLNNNLLMIPLTVGVAALHPNDDFNKRVGREKAAENSRLRHFKVERLFIKYTDNGAQLDVIFEDKDASIHIVYPPKGGPRLGTFHTSKLQAVNERAFNYGR